MHYHPYKKSLIALFSITLIASLLFACGSTPTAEISQTSNLNSSTQEPATKPLPKEETSQIDTISEPIEEIDQTITIRMVGDILLHTRVEESSKDENGNYDFSAIFTNVGEDIADADIAIVNQEVIIGGEELGISGYPAFNAPTEIGDALTDTGFDVICQATNHAMDKGKKGIVNTLAYWDTNKNATPIGIYDSEEESNDIFVTEIKGVKLAILNYTYGTNGIELPSDMPYAVNLLNENEVRNDIKKAKELADFIIVCPHWGTEYRLSPDSMQEKWTKIFFEEGVNLVIGTHPHVIEPIELIENENSQMLVYYSLGNFVNWTSGEGSGVYQRMVGGMANVVLSIDENNEISISDYGVQALVTDLSEGYQGVTTYKLSDYTEDMAEKNLIRNQDPSFTYENIHTLCDEVWGELWY